MCFNIRMDELFSHPPRIFVVIITGFPLGFYYTHNKNPTIDVVSSSLLEFGRVTK